MASQQDSGFFEISIKSLLKSWSGGECGGVGVRWGGGVAVSGPERPTPRPLEERKQGLTRLPLSVVT